MYASVGAQRQTKEAIKIKNGTATPTHQEKRGATHFLQARGRVREQKKGVGTNLSDGALQFRIKKRRLVHAFGAGAVAPYGVG